MANTRVHTELVGAGGVVQVVQGAPVGDIGISSLSYVDTGLFVNITPKSTTNKVYVCAHISLQDGASAVAGEHFLQIYRNTTIIGGEICYWDPRTGGGGSLIMGFGGHLGVLDSPATTSQVTYRLYARTTSGGQLAIMYTGTSGHVQQQWLTAMEIAA